MERGKNFCGAEHEWVERGNESGGEGRGVEANWGMDEEEAGREVCMEGDDKDGGGDGGWQNWGGKRLGRPGPPLVMHRLRMRPKQCKVNAKTIDRMQPADENSHKSIAICSTSSALEVLRHANRIMGISIHQLHGLAILEMWIRRLFNVASTLSLSPVAIPYLWRGWRSSALRGTALPARGSSICQI